MGKHKEGARPCRCETAEPLEELEKSCLAEASNEVSGACDKKQSEGQLEGGL